MRERAGVYQEKGSCKHTRARTDGWTDGQTDSVKREVSENRTIFLQQNISAIV